MGKNYTETANTSKPSVEKQIKELNQKIETIEHTNVVLEDKIKQYEDPNNKPRIIRRGAVKKSLKFQANNVKCSPIDGHVINPIVAEPVPVKQ